jgi:uncharacterized protein YjbI with pentapeptide repeats
MSDKENKDETKILQKAKQKLQPYFQKLKTFSDKLDEYADVATTRLSKLKNPPKWIKLFLCGLVAIGLAGIAYVTFLGIWHLITKIHFLFFATEISDLANEAKKDNFNALRNALFILAALIGVPFFLWRTGIAQSQASTSRDRAYTELFTKAIEQLGAEKPKKEDVLDKKGNLAKDNAGQPLMREIYVPNIEVRIGAIYALERIMNDSRKDAPAIVDTLAAYVRENCGEPQEFECEIPQAENFTTTGEWLKAIDEYVGDPLTPKNGTLVARAHALRDFPHVSRIDIKTALTVIGRRPDWMKAEEDTKQRPKPDLQKVNLQGWDLSTFNLDFFNLNGAQMQGVDLRGAKMQGADLYNVEMQGANLSKAKMNRANMNVTELQGAFMSNVELQGAELSGTEMQASDISGARMQEAFMISTKLQRAKMDAAKMQKSTIIHTSMQGAEMAYSNMKEVSMGDVGMQGVDMANAIISDSQITTLLTTAASVISVDFSKAEYEQLQAKLPHMFGHKKLTILPEGMKPPDHWSEADMNNANGYFQYKHEWKAFKKQIGYE